MSYPPVLAYVASVNTGTNVGVNNYTFTSHVPSSSCLQFEYLIEGADGSKETGFIHQESIVTEPVHTSEAEYSFVIPVPSDDSSESNFKIDPNKTIKVRVWKKDMTASNWTNYLDFYNPPPKPDVNAVFLDSSRSTLEVSIDTLPKNIISGDASSNSNSEDINKLKYVLVYSYLDVSQNTQWKVSNVVVPTNPVVTDISTLTIPFNETSLYVSDEYPEGILNVAVYAVYEFMVETDVSNETIAYYTVSELSDTLLNWNHNGEDLKASVYDLDYVIVDAPIKLSDIQDKLGLTQKSLYDINNSQQLLVKWLPPNLAFTQEYQVGSYTLQNNVSEGVWEDERIFLPGDLDFTNSYTVDSYSHCFGQNLSGSCRIKTEFVNGMVTYSDPSPINKYTKPPKPMSAQVTATKLLQPDGTGDTYAEVEATVSLPGSVLNIFKPRLFWNITREEFYNDDQENMGVVGTEIMDVSDEEGLNIYDASGALFPTLNISDTFIVDTLTPNIVNGFATQFRYRFNIWIARTDPPVPDQPVQIVSYDGVDSVTLTPLGNLDLDVWNTLNWYIEIDYAPVVLNLASNKNLDGSVVVKFNALTENNDVITSAVVNYIDFDSCGNEYINTIYATVPESSRVLDPSEQQQYLHWQWDAESLQYTFNVTIPNIDVHDVGFNASNVSVAVVDSDGRIGSSILNTQNGQEANPDHVQQHSTAQTQA